MWLYVGVPIAMYALVYTVRLGESVNPAGDAIYAFIVALWLAAVSYLATRYRYVGTLRPDTGQPN
ncbi:hypothetical protein RBH26_08430 [Natronolimnohabitans sp. A-GB9]|uniref:hypothetical protein n=1 Tax=Natronolimnohabitans sp. A-GB9 TaxID=3069757 RepID=UPI0027B84607|nr:hypothetical protein [Natronolimnohabitans sp. A-GB9]MDQ2050512.1 hypothetical protein [Natronolimnohabitans sp. A-GB9]